MKKLITILLLSVACHADGLYLVLTPAQFTTANNWMAAQNGWPDGRGTERYCESLAFNQFSNCPAILQDRVGLVLDKAMIRHIANAIPGETREDKIVRFATIVRTRVSNPTVVRVTPSGGTEAALEADFTDVTATVADKLRALVSQ